MTLKGGPLSAAARERQGAAGCAFTLILCYIFACRYVKLARSSRERT